jgi:hypothetical protein
MPLGDYGFSEQLADPGGQYPLEVVLPQSEPVVVSRGEVADVRRDRGVASAG